jgi:hypothetical protein
MLDAYSGTFFSDELLTYYHFTVQDGALHIQVNNRGCERLDPTTHDRFISHVRSGDDNRIIQFSRDVSGHIDAVTVKLWRVKGIRLQKIPDRH